jgi:hypothetical protein
MTNVEARQRALQQPGQAQDDRPVPQAPRRGRVQRCRQLRETAGVQVPDKPGRAMRNHRDCVLQPVSTQPCRAQEPEERAQRRRPKLHRPRPVTGLSGHRRSRPRREHG